MNTLPRPTARSVSPNSARLGLFTRRFGGPHLRGRRSWHRWGILWVLAFTVLGCGTPQQGQGGAARGDSTSAQPAGQIRSLVKAFRYEKTDLANKTLPQEGGEYKPCFNAAHAINSGPWLRGLFTAVETA